MDVSILFDVFFFCMLMQEYSVGTDSGSHACCMIGCSSFIKDIYLKMHKHKHFSIYNVVFLLDLLFDRKANMENINNILVHKFFIRIPLILHLLCEQHKNGM